MRRKFVRRSSLAKCIRKFPSSCPTNGYGTVSPDLEFNVWNQARSRFTRLRKKDRIKLEVKMNKSLAVRTAFLFFAVLMSSIFLTVATGATSVPTAERLGWGMSTVGLASSSYASPLVTFLDGSLTFDGDRDRGKDMDKEGDHDRDRDHDGDGDHDHDRDHKKGGAPSPTPEPSTLLSFGAALLIGSGVIYSQRLRRSKK